MSSVKLRPGVRPGFQVLSKAIARVLRSSSDGLSGGLKELRPSRLSVSGGAVLGAALVLSPTHPVLAQEQGEDSVFEEITVTGSRIQRRDFTSNAPIQTVNETMFDETTSIGVETVLNRLPQFVPAVTQFTTTDVAQTATNTVGVSTVSLRGLGPNRNLVLINGRRAMPVDPTMVVDTNSIPSSAIQRVEVISGGASAVYGADAVGGVVNFVLKEDFEGASVDVRFGDTQHGGNQEIAVSSLLGANVADNRGNVMFGLEYATRTLQHEWERDWRVADYANPRTPGGQFIWGGTPWIRNEAAFTNPITPPAGYTNNNPARSPAELAARVGWVDQTPLGTVTTVDEIFSALPPGTIDNNVDATNFRINDDGTIFTGMGFGTQTTLANRAPGAYRYNGPLYDPTVPGSGGDHWGNYGGLPVFVELPSGGVKENNFYRWASSPLERYSAFGNGHIDLSDTIRVTAQASFTRTQTESSLGNTAANINQWAAAVPFGNEVYRGNNTPLFPGNSPDRSIYDIPDSLIDVNGDGVADAGDMTNPAYTIDGRFGVECDAPPTAQQPWLDGLPGCTMSEAWPSSAELYNLFMSRPDPNRVIWGNRSPDYLREVLGGGRSTTNTTTTMNFTLGLEGDLPSGDDSWDITLSSGRSDNFVNQNGSVRLSSLRALYLVPNFGRNAIFDPEPVNNGFAETNSQCTTGLPIFQRFLPSQDCVRMISPSLHNEREMKQATLEGNLVGDLVDMRAGPLQYALGAAYRENAYSFVPDYLLHNQNFMDPIAGSFPNEESFGEFDVKEIYGELLVPIVSDGPKGVEHFTLELGGRVSDWSMENMPNLTTYKALIDWGITPRYRLRGGFNRAFRAPNLGELYIARTQVFGGFGTRDWCSENLQTPGTFSATPGPDNPAQQVAQTKAICEAMMGASGAFEYYVANGIAGQPTVGGTGVSNSFGNPRLREEQADTFTIGMAMNVSDNITLTVDWYEIEISDMIALPNADAVYERCLALRFNPTGDPNSAECQLVNRNPSNGGPQNTDRTFTNQGRALMSGVDLQINWQKMVGPGNLSLQSVANYNLDSITQTDASFPEVDHVGYDSCDLQIECQRYEYRLFTDVSYAQGPWNMSLRHQYWPGLDNLACRTTPNSTPCLRSSYPSYQLFALSGSYTFAERYRVTFGIENLLDEDPPCIGGDPNALGFESVGGTACQRVSGGEEGGAGGNYGTYDPLGRRYFMSMTMDF